MDGIGNVNGLTHDTGVKDLKEKPVRVKLDEPVDTLELSNKVDAEKVKEKSNPVKKIGVGIATLSIPTTGIGQLINGEPKKALKYFGRQAGLSVLCGAGIGVAFVASAGAIAAIGGTVAVAAAIGMGINHIASIVDAVKNA